MIAQQINTNRSDVQKPLHGNKSHTVTVDNND